MGSTALPWEASCHVACTQCLPGLRSKLLKAIQKALLSLFFSPTILNNRLSFENDRSNLHLNLSNPLPSCHDNRPCKN